jgi:hypothetical protein
MLMQQGTSAGVPARAPSAADAATAALDARLDAAAKKAAIAALEGQAGSAEAPPAPPAATGRIVIEKDGKTVILDNPTPEQLRAVGMGSTQQRSGDVSGWAAVALTCAVMWGIVAIVYFVLAHRRRMAGVTNLAKPSPDAEARMARIENAIESVAVEVERISEGQRFTTRLLSEGAAMPVGVADRGVRVQQNRGDA